MTRYCVVTGCGHDRTEEGIRLYSIPPEWSGDLYSPDLKELARERRALWIYAINGDFVSDKNLEQEKVCSKHFVTGKPAPLLNRYHPDWVPSLNLGNILKKQRPSHEEEGDLPKMSSNTSEMISLNRDEKCSRNSKDISLSDLMDNSRCNDESSSSSTITATSSTSLYGKDESSSTTPLFEDGGSVASKKPYGKIFVSKSIFKTNPREEISCRPMIPLNSLENINCTSQNVKIVRPQQSCMNQKSIPKQNSTKTQVGNETAKSKPLKKMRTVLPKKTQNVLIANTGVKKSVKFFTLNVPQTKKVRILKEQRVFVKDSSNIDYDGKKDATIGQNNTVLDEDDPLYIPSLVKKIAIPNLPEMKKIQSITTIKNVEVKQLNKNKLHKICSSSSISGAHEKTQPFEMKGGPINPEHSVVKSYAVQNKAAKVPNKKHSSLKNNRKEAKTESSAKKSLPKCTLHMKSDNCRNFFIKNSAWDYLEPTFTGFNERENRISEKCSTYFDQTFSTFNRKQYQEEHNYSDNSLIYNEKIEYLDENGELIRNRSLGKRKFREVSSYTLPPTKKCKIVIERNEKVEERVKNYILEKELNLLVCDHLLFTSEDAKKPLIIVNKLNFNILKINESLVEHSRIIYVKEIDEKFPKKLLENSFLIAQIKKRSITLISPIALKFFFSN